MANVKVAVRVRPLSKREHAEGSSIIAHVDDKIASIRNIKLDSRLDSPGDTRERNIEFTFDYCYWSADSNSANFAPQELVYQDLGTSVLSGAIEGYNVCLFAYGQTGSGKTYTMMGTPASIGLTPRICKGLFSRVDDYQEKPASCRIEVSFLEIYNERVRDLLKRCDGNKPYTLRVREHPDKGPYVQGLSQHLVSDYKQLVKLLEEGISNRITAATHIHDASSRSHAIFTIHYTQAILENHLPSEIVSKINLVDLAGSERADPNFCKDRITEGSNINKSLVTLGIVISTLAQNSQMSSSCQSINSVASEGDTGSHSSAYSGNSRRQCYVPYRDSVLTWLLKDSLGGNSKTIMIATISPASTSYSETISTLRYAAHAKNIINKPRVNEDANVKLIRELREEIDRLKAMLMSFELRNSSPSLSDEKDGSLTEMLLQNELKVDQLTKDWTDRWKDTKAIMEEYYVDINRGKTGVIVASQLPHLIAVDEDILSTGVALYHLREGTTKIGGIDAETEQDIVLQGPWVEREHCVIHNDNGVVTLEPIRGSQCTVNEVDVTHSCRLSQGAVIVLGKVHKFRFNHPTEAAKLRQRRASSVVSLASSGSCEWLDLDGEFNFSPPYVLSPLMQASLEQDKEKDEEMELNETRRQLVELREQYQNKQQEHEEYKQKLKGLEAFYQEQIQQQQCYVEELRQRIQAAQSRAEQELEHDQEQLKQQIEENQQCLANEEKRLVCLEQHRRELGIQTDTALFTECGVQITPQTEAISSIEQDRKRLVQLELLQKHSLRKAEHNISKKRVRYQLERIAGKHQLLEAKTNLQHLEAASLLSEDQLKQPIMDKTSTLQTGPNPKLTMWNKSFPPYSLPARKHSPSVPLLTRRHSDSNDLVSRLYPQYVPVYSDFLKRKSSAASPQTKKHSSAQMSLSVGSLPKVGLPIRRKQPSKQGREPVSPAWDQLHKKQKAVEHKKDTESQALKTSTEGTDFSSKEQAKMDDTSSLQPEVRQLISNVPENKNSSGCLLSETGMLESDLMASSLSGQTNTDKLLNITNEDMRQNLMWKCSLMNTGDKSLPSRVCKKPPSGRLSRAKRFCKESATRASSPSQGQLPIKEASSMVNLNILWEPVPHPHKTRKWHSAEILNAGTATVASGSLGGWLGREEMSDAESLYSLDSLSSLYANALTEQLQEEESEGQQSKQQEDCSESDDSEMSQDSLVDKDAKLAGTLNGNEHGARVCFSHSKVARQKLANRGRSISLDSLTDVEGTRDIFRMDSAESTASDEMPAEVYWNLPWTADDGSKTYQASEVQIDKKEGVGVLKLKGQHFYLCNNTELKATDMDKNIQLENLEPDKNDMDSLIKTDAWSSCESSNGSNMEVNSSSDTPVRAISLGQTDMYRNVGAELTEGPASIWIQPVFNFDPLHTNQHDAIHNFHEIPTFVTVIEDNTPCAENKEGKSVRENDSAQTKELFISTSQTDGVTLQDPSCTDHTTAWVTELLGSSEIEGMHVLATKTTTGISIVPDSVLPTQQSCSLMESQELVESSLPNTCLKLTTSGTDTVIAMQNVDSEMEVTQRRQQENTETERTCTQSQCSLLGDDDYHRRYVHGRASRVDTTKLNSLSSFEKITISGIKQFILQAEELPCHRQSHDETESQTSFDSSCCPAVCNSSRPLLQVLEPKVVVQEGGASVEKKNLNTQWISLTDRFLNLAEENNDNSLLIENMILAPSFIQNETKPISELSTVQDMDPDIVHSTLMKGGNSQTEQPSLVHKGDQKIVEPIIMQGCLDTRCAITKEKDNWDLMPSSVINVALQKAKNHMYLLRNVSGYTSTETLLQATNNTVDSENKLSELKTLDDGHLRMENSIICSEDFRVIIRDSFSQEQSIVSGTSSNKKEGYVSKGKSNEKEKSKISYNPDVEDCLNYASIPLNGDAQDQQHNNNAHAEETTVLNLSISRQSAPRSHDEEPTENAVESRIWDEFNLEYNIVANLNKAYSIRPTKLNFSAESISRDDLPQSFIKKLENINRLVEDGSEISHGPNVERIPMIERVTCHLETTNSRSTHDHKETDTNQNYVVTDFLTVQFNEESSIKAERFTSDHVSTANSLLDGFENYAEICVGNVSAAKLKSKMMVNNAVQGGQCYFDHSLPVDLTEDSVTMTGSGFLRESKECEVTVKKQIVSAGTLKDDFQRTGCAGEEVLDRDAEHDERIICAKLIQRDRVACDYLEQSKSKENSVVSSAGEKFGNNSGTGNYFQTTSTITEKSNVAETDGNARTVSVALADNSEVCVLSTLQKIRTTCTAKSGNKPNEVISFHNEGFVKLNENGNGEARAFQKATEMKGDRMPRGFSSSKYCSEQTCTTKCITENDDTVGGTVKKRSQLCDWTFTEACSTADSSRVAFQSAINASHDASHTGNEAGQAKQENSIVAQSVVLESKNHQTFQLETEHSTETVSNQTRSKYDCEPQMRTDFLTHQTEGNEMLTDIVQDVCRICLESNQEGDAVALIQENNLIGESEGRANDGNTPDINYITETVDNQLPFMIVDCNADRKGFTETASACKGVTKMLTEITGSMAKDYENAKGLDKSKNSVETRSSTEQNGRALLIYNNGQETKMSASQLVEGSITHVGTDSGSQQNYSHQLSSPRSVEITKNNKIMNTRSKKSQIRKEQHVMCEEQLLNFSSTETEHQDFIKNPHTVNRTCTLNGQGAHSFHVSSHMAHESEVGQILANRYSQDLPQEDGITSALGNEVECEINEQSSPKISKFVKSAVSCINSSNNKEQKVSQEEIQSMIENSNCETLQETQMFKMVPCQGNTDGQGGCLAVSPCNIAEHSLNGQQLWTSQECAQAGRLENRATMDLETFSGPPKNSLTADSDIDSVACNLISSKVDSATDHFHLRRKLKHTLSRVNITQQQLAESRAIADTPLLRSNEQNTSYRERVSISESTGNIQGTATSQSSRNTIERPDVSGPQSCFVCIDNLQDINEEKASAGDCQINSTICRKEEYSAPGRSANTLPAQDIVLKEVVGRHVMWYQLDPTAASDVSDFQADLQAAKTLVHSDWAKFVDYHLKKAGNEALANQMQKTSDKNIVCSDVIVANSGTVDAMTASQKRNVFKGHQSPFLHDRNTCNTGFSASGLNVDSSPPTFQGTLKLCSTAASQNASVRSSLLQQCKMFHSQSAVVKSSLQDIPQLDGSQIIRGKSEVSTESSFAHQHEESDVSRCTSSKLVSRKPEEKEVRSEPRLYLHKGKTIETQTLDGDAKLTTMQRSAGLSSLESMLGSELLKNYPAARKDQDQTHIQSLQEQSSSTTGLLAPYLLHAETKCRDVHFSNADCESTFTPQSFIESCGQQKQIALHCRGEEEDSSVSLIDGDPVGMGVSELTESSLNLHVTASERPLVTFREESVRADGMTSSEIVGCAKNCNNKDVPDSTNNGSTRKEVSGSERCEETQLLLKNELNTFKHKLVCNGSTLSLDSHSKNHEFLANIKEESKSKCPTAVDFMPQCILKCINKPSVQTRMQKAVETATSECKSEMHLTDSHVKLYTPVHDTHVQEQPVTQLQQTQNQLAPRHKIRNESKLQIKDHYVTCATPEIAETYNKFSSQESNDLPVIQIDGSDLSSDVPEQSEDSVLQRKQIGGSASQSHESSKWMEMDGACQTIDLSVLSDAGNSSCSVCSSVTQVDVERLSSSNSEFLKDSDALKKKSQRFKRMKPKPITDKTKESSSSGEEIDIEFLSLKELRTRQCGRGINKLPTSVCKCTESMSTTSTKLESHEEEARVPLLKQRHSAPVVQVSSSSVDLLMQGSSGHSLAAALVAKPLDGLDPSYVPPTPRGEQVAYQTETFAERDMDRRLGQNLNLQPELESERVSVNTELHMPASNAVVHSRVTLPCNRGQSNQSVKQQSNDGCIPATFDEFHPRNFTEGKLKDQQFSEVELSFIKDPIHFASSDVNPYIHPRQCDELSRGNRKLCHFGSASNVCNVQSKLSSPGSVVRCSSVDNGLNVQNSPFNSHLSCYVNTRAISGTLSNVSDFQGETFDAAYDLDGDTYQRSCDPSMASSLFRSSQFPSSNSELGNVKSQVDEIVLLYPIESSVKSASDGSLKQTCNQETQTLDGMKHQKLPRHQRSCTQTPTQTPAQQGRWSSLQNLSVHLSQLLHNTTELLGNIHSSTDRSNESTSPSNRNSGMPGATRTADSCTQTVVDVAIQTEALPHNIDKDSQANPRKEVHKSPEVNVIVKVIGSDVSVSQEHTNVTLTVQERQQNCSVPDLNTHHAILSHSLCSPPSTEGGNSSDRTSTPASLDAQKLVANSSQISSFSPGVSPVAASSLTSIHSDHAQGTSISSHGSASEFSKMETNHPSLSEDQEMKSFAQSLQAGHEPASADIRPAVLVDRASSPIQTFEAGSGNHRCRSKSFLCLQSHGKSHGLQQSVYWQRKQRPASWYGFNEKQQRKLQKESEGEQKMEMNGVSLVTSNEQSIFTRHDLSRSAKLKSEADPRDGVQSQVSSVRSEAANACNEHHTWQCESNVTRVGHVVKQVPLCYSQCKATEPQLVLQNVHMPCTSNTDGRKQINSSAFQPTYQNFPLTSFPPTLSKINDGTTRLSRRTFHRSSSMSSMQHGRLSEDGTEFHEEKGRMLEDQTRHQDDSMNDCISMSRTSIMSDETIEFATEDAQSLVLSECNTEVLLNENPSITGCNRLQVSNSGVMSCRGPEDLPLHNKFCNWSGVHYRPASTTSFMSMAACSHRQAEQKQNRDGVTGMVDFKSEVHDERQKEIESLRQERSQIMSGIYLDLNQHQLTVELTEAKLNYGLGETDALLRILQSGAADDLNIPIRQQLYERHVKTIEALRKERDEKLQKFRRTRSLSPQKHLTLQCQNHPTTSHQEQDLPSKRRNYLQRLRQDVVENTRTQTIIKGREETTSEIEYLLRDYQKAREEAKVEIAKARDKLRARAEKEKCRLQQQMISQLLKEEGRVKNVASRSSLCTGSNLSLSSNPTSGYSSSNTASPDINLQIKNKSSADPMIVSRGRTASQISQINVTEHPATEIIQSFHASCPPVELISGNTTKDNSYTASSICLKKYQDLATHTVASVKAEIMVASFNNLRNLLNGNAAAGWRYHCTEKGILMFYKQYTSPTKHGFMGVGVIEKPLHCVWCMVKDHSKRQLYDKAIKTVEVHRQLGNGIELVYLVNDTSLCYLNQPRDFCCISVEAKEDQQYILAMQSIYEESMPRPVKEFVRGEMLPSGWILQPDTHNGKEITRLIYLTQVDLGAPALPARLLGLVAKRQPLCIANLASLLSC
ncbi:stAR-related lipid transfer protein 9 isoform X2 [Heterodontus francisci]|uniref:stAR-related lipid transfer protein 9 isoform X2 n=1 Tax=Heterodontus francisci TaxID=7792 RepID=UPI00355C3EF6